ncbi:MAG: sigma-54-dependent transcriptional regulator, partial [Polyangiales bacterium]
MSRILVVDDQAAVRTALEVLFDVHDLPAESVASPKEALARIAAGGVGVVVQDMNFTANATSGDEGEALFRAIRARDPHMPVLLMTAWTSLETAVRLVREGAADYVAKPWDDEKLVATVRTLLELRGLQEENARLRSNGLRAREALAKDHDLCGLVYASDAMHQVVSLAIQVARSDVPVLITGPNGSGKEKLAEIVQAGSRRRDKPFVRVNAGALPDNLLEAELFGA